MTRLEQTIGACFRNKSLLAAALTHPSYQSQGQSPGTALNFQRLEFFGDAVLNLFIGHKLYDLFPNANEGLLSRLRSILVSRKLLARIAHSIRLRTSLLLGERERNQPDVIREKILADAVEA